MGRAKNDEMLNLARSSLVGIATLILLSANLGAAQLRWDRTEVSLDMEPEQHTIQAKFEVTNEGSEAIRINQIKSSCGCTGSVVDRKFIPAGGSTEIIGTFNRGKRQGLNTNRLQVFIDGKVQPVATLTMAVKIPKLVDAKPQIVFWTPSGSRAERIVQLELDTRYVDTISSIEFDETRLVVTQEDQGNAKTQLKITPIDNGEPYRGSIVIHATGPDGRTTNAKVHAFIQP